MLGLVALAIPPRAVTPKKGAHRLNGCDPASVWPLPFASSPAFGPLRYGFNSGYNTVAPALRSFFFWHRSTSTLSASYPPIHPGFASSLKHTDVLRLWPECRVIEDHLCSRSRISNRHPNCLSHQIPHSLKPPAKAGRPQPRVLPPSIALVHALMSPSAR